VLSRYRPALDGLRWVHVSGGFSGAEVWRGDDDTDSPLFALKAWPEGFTASRLAEIHTQTARAAHLPFIPRVLPTTSGTTFAEDAGRVWDVTRWMPGEPRESPSVIEVGAACAAVARLHAVWHVPAPPGPCPGVLNRLRILGDWLAHPAVSLPNTVPAELRALLQKAAEDVAAVGPRARRALQPWATVRLPLQPCVRDLRGEHVLFRDTEATGIVDFGALAHDYPGVDLARLLGDFAEADEGQFARGLAAYRAAGGMLDEPDDFVRLLSECGTVCSVIGWLVRAVAGPNSVAEVVAAQARVARLLARMTRFRTL
jgi:homoserine kinase type II